MFDLDIQFFKKINNAYGAQTKKETLLYEAKRNMSDAYDETLDLQPHSTVDGELMPLIVMEPHGLGSEKDKLKKIEALPGSVFYLGSKVGCFGQIWLVTKINHNQELKLTGEMRLCNYVLNFQDEDGNIINEECICEKRRTNATGEDIGNNITVDDTRRNILLQFNKNTAKIVQGRRFFIDLEGLPNPKAYKLTDLDRINYTYNGKGYFSLVCKEEQRIGDRDRPDLMICDYFEPENPPPTPIGSCKIVFSGAPTLKTGGNQKHFTFIACDDDSEIIPALAPTWSLIMPPELEALNQVVITGELDNEIALSVSHGDNAIGMSFVLKAVCDDPDYGLFETEQKIHIVKLF